MSSSSHNTASLGAVDLSSSSSINTSILESFGASIAFLHALKLRQARSKARSEAISEAKSQGNIKTNTNTSTNTDISTILNANTSTAVRFKSVAEMVTIVNARITFRRIAMFALAEMGNVCQVYETIPKGLAKSLINRRLLVLIDGYIKMINLHEAYVDGAQTWTLQEARNAVYVIGQVQRGFNYLLQVAQEVARTPAEELPKLGKDLHKMYLEKYGDMF